MSAREKSDLPKVVEKLSFTVKDLDNAPESVDHIDVVFAVETDSLGTEHGSVGVARIADRVAKCPGCVEGLDAEVIVLDHPVCL